MTPFKGFPEINFVEGQVDDLHRIETNTGRVIIAGHFANADEGQRLVDCWNATRKIFAPAAHIEASEEYTGRLERLRREAWARVEQLETGDLVSASVWNHDMTSAPLGKEVSVTRRVTVDGEKQDRQFREHHVAPVWLAMPSGKVIRSYWIPPMKTSAGRWSGCSENEQPIAWQHFVVPAHPTLTPAQAAGEAA